jgi:hypothetical protein
MADYRLHPITWKNVIDYKFLIWPQAIHLMIYTVIYHIGGIMVSVLASSEVDRGFEPQSGQIDYITITCNLKNGRLQITSDYMKKCNRLQRLRLQITITLPSRYNSNIVESGVTPHKPHPNPN